MSKISLEFDTETKKLMVSVNGAEVPGVESCYIYRCCDCYDGHDEEEKHYVEICTKEETEDDTMRIYKRICAADKNISIETAKSRMLKTIAKKVFPGYKG